MKTIVQFLHFCPHSRYVFLGSRRIVQRFQILFHCFYPSDMSGYLKLYVSKTMHVGCHEDTFSVLSFNSSTLACSAAEAFWYSSKRWYAA